MTEEALIRPSGLALTVACNASLQLQASVPPLPETDDQALGHAAHWVARRYSAGFESELPIGAKFHYGGAEWTVDADMHTGAKMYMRTMGAPHPELHLEERVDIKRVHEEHCKGTPDGWRYYSDAREVFNVCPAIMPPDLFNRGLIKLLRVFDYKYGHRFVEVFESYQTPAYATGIADKLGLQEGNECLYVELVIVQPRSYHPDGPVRSWLTRFNDLRGVINIARGAAEAALRPLGTPNGPLAKTGNHCLDCTARHVCETLRYNTASLVDFSHTPERVELSPTVVGQEMRILEDAIKQLEARYSGLAAHAEALIRSGNSVPLYHMEPGRSILTYYNDVDTNELINLGELMNIDLRRKLDRKDQVVTPTQAIQLGIDEKVMSHYAYRPPGKLKLTRDNSTTARKVFAK